MADDGNGRSTSTSLDPPPGSDQRDSLEGMPLTKIDAADVIHRTLVETTKLFVKQKFEALTTLADATANAVETDALAALGVTANKYDAYTDDGGLRFRVVESSRCCGLTGRFCCEPHHKLQLHVFHEGQEVLFIDRGVKCAQCCAFSKCCQQEMTVYRGPGKAEKLAHIMEPWGGGGFSPTLEVMDRDGTPFATVKSKNSCCIGGLCCDHTFDITDSSGKVIGQIVKTEPNSLGAFAKDIAVGRSVFALDVPKDMPPEQKAAMLASLHLVVYWLFEGEGDCVCNCCDFSCTVKCCDLYCFGCVWPCSCDLLGDE